MFQKGVFMFHINSVAVATILPATVYVRAFVYFNQLISVKNHTGVKYRMSKY